MATAKSICLPKLPKGEYYEDFVAALLCCGGYFIEKRIELRNPTNILELDVVTSKYTSDYVEKSITEIKSGGWGLPDVFKVRGWLDYLKIDKAFFVCLNNTKSNFSEMQDIAKELKINLCNVEINDEDTKKQELLNAFNIAVSNKELYECAAFTLRLSFCAERMMVGKYLKELAKNSQCASAYHETQDFIYTVCEHSFFQNNAWKRLQEVFGAYKKYKNITARMDAERNASKDEDADKAELSESSFSKLFYKCEAEKNPLHVALYAEMMCRLSMLQLSIEESYRDNELKGLLKTLEKLGLPNNINAGISVLREKHEYYYLYPHFWQIFIFVFGGFILEEKREEEYKMLSELTDIPSDQVPNALKAFDILFPIANDSSWLFTNSYSKITILQFMPLPISGAGANFRRIIYCIDDKHASYMDLGKQFSSDYTRKDLTKYNNLLIEYLYMDTAIHANQ